MSADDENHLQHLVFTKNESVPRIPEHTSLYQTDDGTVFYHFCYSSRNDRLYVRWKGEEVEAKLPTTTIACTSARGNSIYFHAQEKCAVPKIYKCDFTPGSGFKISAVRDLQQDERRLFINNLMFRRQGDEKFIYRIFDDPNKDAIPVTLTDSEQNELRAVKIHRGRVIYHLDDQSSDCFRPSILKWSGSFIVIKTCQFGEVQFCDDTSPFVCITSFHGSVLNIIDTRSMQILPGLKGMTVDRSTIHIILNIKNQEITMISINGDLMTARLPEGYFEGDNELNQFQQFNTCSRDLMFPDSHFDLASNLEEQSRNKDDATWKEGLEGLERVIEKYPNLCRSLDVSYWNTVGDLRCLRPLSSTLTRLILFNVPDLYKAVDSISNLSQLEVLDLSQCKRVTGVYPKPATCLSKLITSLPSLTHLDISFTNLATPPSENDWPDIMRPTVLSDIYGLRFLRKPLEFLGLLNCGSASFLDTIPAKTISGMANDNQMLTALRVYSSRDGLVQQVILMCNRKYVEEKTELRNSEILELILQVMRAYLHDDDLQINGTVCLIHIIKKMDMNEDEKRGVVSMCISGMDFHKGDWSLLNHYSALLNNLPSGVPEDLFLGNKYVITTILNTIQELEEDSTIPVFVFDFFGSMCRYRSWKTDLGNYGFVELALQNIEKIVFEPNEIRNAYRSEWCFLVNMTDENDNNCETLTRTHNLNILEQCFNESNHEGLNILIVIGNIVEIESLRYKFMTDSYIRTLTAYLAPIKVSIESSIGVPYASAQILAHLLSDGEEAWKRVSITRMNVMNNMMHYITQWKMDYPEIVSYGTLRPILCLIQEYGSPASQHWAAWALAHLTTSKGYKYCRLLLAEGGENPLKSLVNCTNLFEGTKKLAQSSLDNLSKWSNPLIEEKNTGSYEANDAVKEVGSSAFKHDGIVSHSYSWIETPSKERQFDGDNDFKSEFLEKFKLLSVLGQGTFGCVFEARHAMDEYSYAVKRIPLKGSAEAVNNALKEVRTLASLKHNGIVGYNSSWIESPPKDWQKQVDAVLFKKQGYNATMNYEDDCVFMYIQMELCKESLDAWIYANKTRDLNQAKRWFKQLVRAVGYLHKNNKIHRDLKPSNILFDVSGRLKICDLGLIAERTLRNGQEIDRTLTNCGTRMYMAPEQFWEKYSSKVDIFSLGLILSELCVCMTMDEAYEVFMAYRGGRPTTILTHLPEVDQFVSWLTNVDPAKRPTCEEIIKFLA